MRKRNQYMEALMSDFHAAKQAWWEAAEYETMMYATELAEYKETHPMPTLKTFMRARAEARHAADAEAAREATEAAERAAQWAHETAILAALEAEWVADELAMAIESEWAAAEALWAAEELSALEASAIAEASRAVQSRQTVQRSRARVRVARTAGGRLERTVEQLTRGATAHAFGRAGPGERLRVRERLRVCTLCPRPRTAPRVCDGSARAPAYVGPLPCVRVRVNGSCAPPNGSRAGLPRAPTDGSRPPTTRPASRAPTRRRLSLRPDSAQRAPRAGPRTGHKTRRAPAASPRPVSAGTG